MPIVILKTTKDTLASVVQHAKHAQVHELQLSRGDIILISQTEDTLDPGQLPIRYKMEFERCYPDTNRESVQIWGKYWPYIVEGSSCRRLRRPFKMNDVRITEKDYGRGGVRVYVHPRDEARLRERGYLEVSEAGPTNHALKPTARDRLAAD